MRASEKRRSHVNNSVTGGSGGRGFCDLANGFFDLFVGSEVIVGQRIAERRCCFAG